MSNIPNYKKNSPHIRMWKPYNILVGTGRRCCCFCRYCWLFFHCVSFGFVSMFDGAQKPKITTEGEQLVGHRIRSYLQQQSWKWCILFHVPCFTHCLWKINRLPLLATILLLLLPLLFFVCLFVCLLAVITYRTYIRTVSHFHLSVFLFLLIRCYVSFNSNWYLVDWCRLNCFDIVRVWAVRRGKQATIFHRFDGWFYCWGGMLKYGATHNSMKTILHSRWMDGHTTNGIRSPPKFATERKKETIKHNRDISCTQITWTYAICNVNFCCCKWMMHKHNWFRLLINRLRWNEVECDMKIQFPSIHANSISSI